MIANKLNFGDEIRVIAPSRSLSIVRQEVVDHAHSFWQSQGFRLTFSKNSRELTDYSSSRIESRVEDIHEAFSDPNVKMVITCIGGFNSNQLLRYLDYDLIGRNPKILCGFSDVTALLNAVYAKTGLITYHGPHFSTFGFPQEDSYMKDAFYQCVMQEETIEITPSKAAGDYHVIQEGCCEGAIIGGNLCTLNLLQGTPYMPDVRDKVLFLEDDNIMGDYFVYEFDRNLESLLQVCGADTIKGIVFGRFQENCNFNPEVIAKVIRGKVMSDIPVVFGVDFGHVHPIITFPIGGMVRIDARKDNVKLELITH